MTASQQLFRLHWKNHSPNFVTVFSQLFKSESLVDVTLAADGQQIQAHRVVLSACSTYFQDLFVKHPGQHPIVILKDINFRDLCTVIQFMYYGEVNIQHDQLNSILKTAEVLHVKGFADVADKESFSAALLTRMHSEDVPRQYCDQLSEPAEDHTSLVKRKRLCHGSTSSQSKSSQEQSSPYSPESKREHFQASREGTASSFRSTGSFENNSVIRSQSSLMAQSSIESLTDNDLSCKNGEAKLSISSSVSLDIPNTAAENGSYSVDIPHPKQKRTRTLMRQERIVKKEGEKDVCGESERGSPVIQTLQTIRPKSPNKGSNELELLEPRTQTQPSTTYLQLPSVAPQLIRQRTHPLPSGSPGPLLSSSRNLSPTPTHPALSSGGAHTSIPTLAVTPVNSTPNIVIEQYPTILRVVSVEDVTAGNEFVNASTPTLIRTQSQSGSGNANTLQVPGLAPETVQSSHSGGTRLRVKPEDHLRRSVSNPGVSSSSSATVPSNGHCPVLRTGAALGCNYCWNTNDSHGRILRRKTKYHCPDCQANLCIVPCFQEYHEKFVTSSSNETKPGGPQSKGHTTNPQITKMSSI